MMKHAKIPFLHLTTKTACYPHEKTPPIQALRHFRADYMIARELGYEVSGSGSASHILHVPTRSPAPDQHPRRL